jgi:carboxymethylenebutenolidase
VCHSDESRPPAPPMVGDVAHQGDLTLTASDGNNLLAYAAHPVASNGIGIAILPDVRGLHTYYRELAARFAEAGFDAVAIDYFGRTAPDADRTEAFEWGPQVQQTTPEGIAADTAAAIAFLRSASGGAVGSVFTVGFCFGGGNSWRQAAEGHGLAGAIGFYGRAAGPEAVEAALAAPLLLLLAGADQNIHPEDFDGLLDRLSTRGLPAERYVYDGAPHSFFDRSFADHRDQCSDAWTRILDFTARYGATAAGG